MIIISGSDPESFVAENKCTMSIQKDMVKKRIKVDCISCISFAMRNMKSHYVKSLQ